jgi:imidazolonepropionase-like amidohydrolase
LKIIKAKRIIDGTGAGLLLEHAVLLKDGCIQAIIPWDEIKFDAEILDLGDMTLLPGFIDTHLHITLDPGNPNGYYDPEQNPYEIILRAVSNAQSALRAGITTIGDCGARNEIIFPVRQAFNDGALIGPRILTSGNAIATVGGHGVDRIGRIASGIAEIQNAVRQQAEAGADFIKVMATSGGGEQPGESHYGVKELTALREEAEKYNLVVAAHAHGTQGIRDCVAAGIQRIEHCSFFNGEAGFDFDSQAAQAIADQGIIVSPTNVIDYRRIEQGGVGAPRDGLNTIWKNLLAHGVSFAASSDAGVTDMFYDDYALIPSLMVSELGMSPMDAILACTQTAAKALGLQDEIGTLEVGKTADMVAVYGNPLEEIDAIRQVYLVMRAGKILHQINKLDD